MTKEVHNIYSTLTEILQSMLKHAEYGPPDPHKSAIVLKHFKSIKDELSLEEKGKILKECMKFTNPNLAKEISKEMGCSITTKAGFTKVMPLIEFAGSRFFAKRAMELDLFNQFIESEYGKIEGLTLFERLMKPYFTPSVGRDPFVFHGNEKDYTYLEKILKGQDIFDFLMQKDNKGNFIAKESQYLKSTLWLVLPGVTKNKKHQWECGLRQALTNACRKNPEKMRAAVETCLFTIDGKPEQIIANYFWGERESLSGWMGHMDVLYKEGIISGKELQDLFSQIFQPSQKENFLINGNYPDSLTDRITGFRNFIQNNWNIIKNLDDFSEETWKNFDMSTIKKSFSVLQLDLKPGENINEIKKKIENEVLSFPAEVEKTILLKTNQNTNPSQKNILKI